MDGAPNSHSCPGLGITVDDHGYTEYYDVTAFQRVFLPLLPVLIPVDEQMPHGDKNRASVPSINGMQLPMAVFADMYLID